MSSNRPAWASRLGFILAASGSAIGLGNIVFFGANAYQFGGGAFYLPYLIALFVVGIPVMMLEFALGRSTRKAFPAAMKQAVGAPGEFVGWWALLNASVICAYYVTLLGWVVLMLFGAFGELWKPSVPTPEYAPETLPNPVGYFFNALASPWALVAALFVWLLNVLICSKGTKSIEAAVKLFVPAMWLMMIVLVIRGLTLEGGVDGVLYLFTPDFGAMGQPEVWRGAFSQIFFSLSLGFGLLTAYASYLPKDANTNSFAIQTSLLNCAFEYVAGFAIFSMLFAFAIVPKASTLAMSFFVLPQGIASLPTGVTAFGILFFVLLLVAGLSSSISLVEGLSSALIDKFQIPRKRCLTLVFIFGALGSVAFAWPKVIDGGLGGDGTLGLTLLDLVDNKAFGYGLLLVGLAECVLLAWFHGSGKLAEVLGTHGTLKTVFQALVGVIIPAALVLLLGLSFYDELNAGMYGLQDGGPVKADVIGTDEYQFLAYLAPLAWAAITVGGALALTMMKGRDDEETTA
ncbi:MAG: sodium-dependent transporter [Acidobacteriota bacterium]